MGFVCSFLENKSSRYASKSPFVLKFHAGCSKKSCPLWYLCRNFAEQKQGEQLVEVVKECKMQEKGKL
jgi:hypothetical protein